MSAAGECPWCGVAGVEKAGAWQGVRAFYVACLNDGCEVRAETPFCTTAERAREAWNRRTPAVPEIVEPDEIKEMRNDVIYCAHMHSDEETADRFTVGNMRAVVYYVDALRAALANSLFPHNTETNDAG
jgi:hypothetical protein